MAVNRSVGQEEPSVAEAQLARIAVQGCAHHSYLNSLLTASGRLSGASRADAVHLLCSLHGQYPGLIELALQHCREGRAKRWLAEASEGFELERLYLVRLTAAVGPLPSTPGAAETEASLVAARHALETLAKSERWGCALGAATALVGDWSPIRQLLDRAATRVGADAPPPSLPDRPSIVAIVDLEAESAPYARALAFGGEQLLLQHRALFDLLEARSEARGEY